MAIQCRKYCFFQFALTNHMAAAEMAVSLITRAYIIWIFPDFSIFIFSGTHQFPNHAPFTVRTFQYPRKQIDFIFSRGNPCIHFSQILYCLEIIFRDDWLMHVFYDDPLFRPFLYLFFHLMIRRCFLSLYNVAKIRLILQNTLYRNRTP